MPTIKLCLVIFFYFILKQLKESYTYREVVGTVEVTLLSLTFNLIVSCYQDIQPNHPYKFTVIYYCHITSKNQEIRTDISLPFNFSDSYSGFSVKLIKTNKKYIAKQTTENHILLRITHCN